MYCFLLSFQGLLMPCKNSYYIYLAGVKKGKKTLCLKTWRLPQRIHNCNCIGICCVHEFVEMYHDEWGVTRQARVLGKAAWKHHMTTRIRLRNVYPLRAGIKDVHSCHTIFSQPLCRTKRCGQERLELPCIRDCLCSCVGIPLSATHWMKVCALTPHVQFHKPIHLGIPTNTGHHFMKKGNAFCDWWERYAVPTSIIAMICHDQPK